MIVFHESAVLEVHQSYTLQSSSLQVATLLRQDIGLSISHAYVGMPI